MTEDGKWCGWHETGVRVYEDTSRAELWQHHVTVYVIRCGKARESSGTVQYGVTRPTQLR